MKSGLELLQCGHKQGGPNTSLFIGQSAKLRHDPRR